MLKNVYCNKHDFYAIASNHNNGIRKETEPELVLRSVQHLLHYHAKAF
jgi:hypothetical protein